MNRVRIAHLSDVHFDGSEEFRAGLDALVSSVRAREPDLVVVTGDLSADGRPEQLDEVAAALDRLGGAPRIVVPGNRDLEPSGGPPGEARPLPAGSDLDYFLTLEPALALGLEDEEAATPGPAERFAARFGPPEPTYGDERVQVVTVDSTSRLRPEALDRVARRMRRARPGAVRVFALHHGLLPVPGRKLRDGDLAGRSGDLLALLCDLRVDLALHGHVHRAHAWRISSGGHGLVVASAGGLVNDGRRDASFLEIDVDDESLSVLRRSVATGRPTTLFEGRRG